MNPSQAQDAGPALHGAVRPAVGDLVAGLGVGSLTAAGTWWLLDRPTSFLLISGMVYLALAAVIMVGLPPRLPMPGMGSANRITLFRATLVVPVGALALELQALSAVGYWWVIALTTIALVLDGTDGRIARRTGTETEFGARFDMELDAALILVLCVLSWSSGKVGIWVLLIGLMRYAFVGASWVWPMLKGELPPSRRRKWVCVIQGVALLVALGPIIPVPMAKAAAFLGLASLTYSFGVDVLFLLRGKQQRQNQV